MTTPQWPPARSPGPRPPRRSRTGLVVAIALGALVLSGGAVAAFLVHKSDDPANRTTPANTATPERQPREVYVQPAEADLCRLADPLIFRAGTPGKGTVEKEDTRFVLNGCTWDLTAADSTNTFKIFAAAGDDVVARYEESDKIWGTNTVVGYQGERITGLGDKATYAQRLTAQNRRLEAVLALYYSNLYLELRFSGGGTKQWDAGAIREQMIVMSRGAMARVPKRGA